jgi:hypothetical protein
LSEWLKTILASLVGGVIAVSGTLIVEHYYRPAQQRMQIQAELFRATYDNRIESYQAIVQMFSDVYWLEREPAKDKEQRRKEVLQNIQRQIIRSSPIVDRKVFELAMRAFNNYIEQSANFTPELRTKWVNDYVNPLVEAMRADLRQDEITKGVAENIFQIAPSIFK